MPNAVELRLQYLVELLRDAILDGDFAQIDKAIDAFQLLDQQIHYVQHVRLDLCHARRDWDVQLDDLRFVGAQRLLDGGLESRPQVKIGDKQIAHHFFDVAVAVCERFDAVAERLDETGFVALPVETQRERLLAGFDDFVGAKNDDTGHQFDGDAALEEVDD